jgi:hypothetical protein
MSRVLAGILSIWLAICLAEPAQLHTCVMHGGLAIDTHRSADASTHLAAGHSHHQQGDDGKTKQCSCLGDCNAGRNLIGPPPAPASFASRTVEPPAEFPRYESPSIASQCLIPFANGPPDASSRA